MVKISVISSAYRCAQYLEEYLEYVKDIDNAHEVEVLLLHNDPTEEELQIVQSCASSIPHLKHIIIKEREGLYATWNRGIKLSQGEYCTIWNIDDIRTKDSLRKEAEILDMHPEAGMAYGNYILSRKYGETCGILVNEIDAIAVPHEAKVSHLVGCFPMWIKKIHDKIGYFDEQFKLVADYEFQVRTAYNYPIYKVNHILGYFLNGVGNEGRLSQKSNLQNQERTAVEIRYGIYYKMNLIYYKSALQKFDINHVYSYNQNFEISNYIPQYKFISKYSTSGIAKACLRLPKNILKYLKDRIIY